MYLDSDSFSEAVLKKSFTQNWSVYVLTTEQLAEAVAVELEKRGVPKMMDKMILGRYVPGRSIIHPNGS